MKNPLRSEAAAYRFLIGTAVYFGAIAIASVAGGSWAGLAVFVVATAVVLVWLFRGPGEKPPEE
jgi:hypothetical protein